MFSLFSLSGRLKLQRDEEINFQSAGSFLKWQQQPGMDHAEARSSIPNSHVVGRNPSSWAIFCHLHMSTNRELGQKWYSLNLKWCSNMGCQRLSPLHHNANPERDPLQMNLKLWHSRTFVIPQVIIRGGWKRLAAVEWSAVSAAAGAPVQESTATVCVALLSPTCMELGPLESETPALSTLPAC